MNISNSLASPNLVIAWIWILAGFISGAILGCFFHREDWLGGYGSLRRRMYRLGHISFFGLSLINLLFFFTAAALQFDGPAAWWASRGFVVGAIAMPICCGLMAHFPGLRLLFAVPVVSLIAAAGLTVWKVLQY